MKLEKLFISFISSNIRPIFNNFQHSSNYYILIFPKSFESLSALWYVNFQERKGYIFICRLLKKFRQIVDCKIIVQRL